MNKVILTGTIVRDAKNYETVTKFTMAVHDGNKMDFIDCTAFGNNAKYAADFKKGDRIAVEGKLKSNSYEDKNGERVYKTEVHTTEQHMIKKAQPKQAETQEAAKPEYEPPMDMPEDDALPFE